MNLNRSFALRLLLSIAALGLLCLVRQSGAQQFTPSSVKDQYMKTEHQIAMRDGVKLYTVVYSPKNISQKYPILMTRTPYGSGPYGADSYPPSLGPSPAYREEK